MADCILVPVPTWVCRWQHHDVNVQQSIIQIVIAQVRLYMRGCLGPGVVTVMYVAQVHLNSMRCTLEQSIMDNFFRESMTIFLRTGINF